MDAIWKYEGQALASAAQLLCTVNGQVTGVKDSVLDNGGFGRLQDRRRRTTGR
jgi:hypothetical protein